MNMSPCVGCFFAVACQRIVSDFPAILHSGVFEVGKMKLIGQMVRNIRISGMKLAELQTFLTIVETGSLMRTSEVLNITQSTVTARLQSLEDKLGQRLINRARSGASLTAAGERLRRYADTIADLWQQAQREISLPRGLSGVCNLACESDLWVGLGARLFDHLKKTQPDLAISVWLGSAGDIAGWLNDGKSDLAITTRATTSPRQNGISLEADRLVLVSTDPAAPSKFDPGYVFVEGGEEFGRDHAKAYADANTARFSFGSASLGLAHILSEGGSAYLPRRLVLRHLAEKRLFLVASALEFRRPTYLAYNKSAQQTWDWFENSLTVLPTAETA